MRVILALGAALAGVTGIGGAVAPAHAHFCSTPVEINVGQAVAVNVGVGAEAEPVREVDIEIPAGFDLIEPVGYLGYTGTVRGKYAHFEGAEIAPYTCTYFSLNGTAVRRGRLVVKIITTAPDGTKTRYSSTNPLSPLQAQLIYAGIPIPDMAVSGAEDDGPNVLLIVGGALLAGAAAVGVAILVRRRRFN